MSFGAPRRVEPASKCRVILLFNLIEPDRYVPAGKYTVPPPAALHASIALLMAPVTSVAPSSADMKSLTLNADPAGALNTGEAKLIAGNASAPAIEVFMNARRANICLELKLRVTSSGLNRKAET